MSKNDLGKFIIISALTTVFYYFSQQDTSPTISALPVEAVHREPAQSQSSFFSVKTEVNESQNLLAEIQVTALCYESQNCDFSQEDSRAYDFAVGQKLKEQLNSFYQKYGKDKNLLEQRQSLAQKFVQSSDGHVQEVAFALMKDLTPSTENLDAIIAGLQDSPDPLIAGQGLNELKKYLGTEHEPKVHEFIQNYLRSGPHFSAQETAKYLPEFINSKSYPGYLKTYQSMSKSSTTAQNLKTILDEFTRKSSAG